MNYDDDDGYYDDDGEEEEEVELDNPWGLKPVDTDDASLLEDITLEDIANRWDSQGEGANMEDYEVYEGHGKEKLDKLLDYLQKGEPTEERPPRSDRTSGERLEYTHSQHEGEEDDGTSLLSRLYASSLLLVAGLLALLGGLLLLALPQKLLAESLRLLVLMLALMQELLAAGLELGAQGFKLLMRAGWSGRPL